ncbi:chemotaxis response regulator protein-glutamate methylesterase [Bacillus sp. CECT 9360]|uniref:protein-glutamate methylesterase/protein-glutamine glutaminase n=1 Tax=Bacillus sp. CECT 9360 TaxID=2845821 RepID=UPI001E412F89|nr:chemotaxis response regulator protein-glutamate methylesterase [Bacillus sp. CECT 9360]CAH0346171.1 Protein-glutamate methylesterase/protein-glutamine glutaminase [Bacillus sp. CECT 9360]
MEKIKVLIVEDSAFMRKLITEFLSEEDRIEVIGTARNGEEALKKIEEHKPDVITLDVEMPVMNGLEALKIIMEKFPTPVIMLSSTTREGTDSTFTAMNMGAFDFVAKPSGSISLDLHKIKQVLIEKIIAASKISVHRLQKSYINVENSVSDRNIYSKIEAETKKSNNFKNWNSSKKKLIVIGTSTGGPRALQAVLTRLPGNLDAPVLIVQHMPAGFTKSLADRLNGLSAITVKEAEEGEVLHIGTAYIAPGGYHLKVKKIGMNLAVSLDKSEPRGGHRPSVDVLFESVSEFPEFNKVAVVMTGMGSDGSKGLIQLKNKGEVKAIAESQETSIVFGMPKAAIATSLVDSVEDIDKIAKAIVTFC